MSTNPTPDPVIEQLTEQPKKSNPFSDALRAKAKSEPFVHDSYFGQVLNAIADVVESVS